MTKSQELAREYFRGLEQAYRANGGGESWDSLSAAAQGAREEDLAALTALYPDAPESLLELLRLVDGTYYRKYPKGEVCCLFLGSDMEEYPYYLLSARQMIDTRDQFAEWADYLIHREFGDSVDEAVTHDLEGLHWLHFSDCVNNGGTSQLFIDFSPSPTGKKGQIVRYLHDPDELAVIADSFDEYLQMLMENEYDFIGEDSVL